MNHGSLVHWKIVNLGKMWNIKKFQIFGDPNFCEPSSHIFSVNFELWFTFFLSSQISSEPVNHGSKITAAPKKFYFFMKLHHKLSTWILGSLELVLMNSWVNKVFLFLRTVPPISGQSSGTRQVPVKKRHKCLPCPFLGWPNGWLCRSKKLFYDNFNLHQMNRDGLK